LSFEVCDAVLQSKALPLEWIEDRNPTVPAPRIPRGDGHRQIELQTSSFSTGLRKSRLQSVEDNPLRLVPASTTSLETAAPMGTAATLEAP